MDSEVKILLVEDDENLGFVVKDNLEQQGFDVELCKDGEEAFEVFKKIKFQLCLVDVMLPKKDGFMLSEQMRSLDLNVPILFITAKSMTEDRLEGFKRGGDDYIVKPFSMEELIFRINVFLKRPARFEKGNHKFDVGKFIFDYDNLTLKLGSSIKTLTQKEADVLQLFCLHKGEVLKREFILKEIWGVDDYFLGRSMDVFISKLRKYLKDDPSIKIGNYHGIGFKFTIGD